MTGWAISLGLYPGILLGFRSYIEDEIENHVLYLPFVDICFTIHKDVLEDE
jgi:hypothetical protein